MIKRDKGFKTYIDPETRTKIHFRKEKNGYGVIIIRSSKVVYANPTATFFIEKLLSGYDSEKAAREAVKKFKGVTFEEAKKDFEDVAYKINSLIVGEACPVTYLGIKRLDPLSFETSAPFRVDLALTYECNNRCIHCYSTSPRSKKGELTLKEWKKVIDKLYDVGVPNLLFTGGEPTLSKYLIDLIVYAEKKGIVTGLVTNGRKLSDEAFVKRLADAGLDYIQITLESHIPEIHDKITQVKGSWEETVNGIKNVIRADIYVDVNTTLNKLNINYVEGFVVFLHELGVKNISANRLIYSGKALQVREWLEPSFDEMRNALEDIIEKSHEYGMKFTWYGVTRYCELNPLELGLGLKFCSACSITLAIEPDGAVLPCQSYYHPVGNILKDKWDKIWHSELCESIRKRKYADPLCSKCPYYSSCGGGCPLESQVRPYNIPLELVSIEK